MPSLREIIVGIEDTAYYDASNGRLRIVKGDAHAAPILEYGHAEVFGAIGDARPGGITVSFGGFIGLDWIRHASPDRGGILCDVNANQKPFWEDVFRLIAECKTDKAFNSRFVVSEPEYEKIYGLRSSIRYGTPSYTREINSWLSNRDSYGCIRNLVMGGNIAAMTLDAVDKARYSLLADVIKRASLRVNLIYLSNIPHFMGADKSRKELEEGKATDFYERSIMPDVTQQLYGNQLMLCDSGTRIICAELEYSKMQQECGDIYKLKLYDNKQLHEKAAARDRR